MREHLLSNCAGISSEEKTSLQETCALQAAKVVSNPSLSRKSLVASKSTSGKQSYISEHMAPLRMTPEQKKRLDMMALRFFVMNNIPFFVARSSFYLEYITELRPGYVPAGKTPSCFEFSVCFFACLPYSFSYVCRMLFRMFAVCLPYALSYVFT